MRFFDLDGAYNEREARCIKARIAALVLLVLTALGLLIAFCISVNDPGWYTVIGVGGVGLAGGTTIAPHLWP